MRILNILTVLVSGVTLFSDGDKAQNSLCLQRQHVTKYMATDMTRSDAE